LSRGGVMVEEASPEGIWIESPVTRTDDE